MSKSQSRCQKTSTPCRASSSFSRRAARSRRRLQHSARDLHCQLPHRRLEFPQRFCQFLCHPLFRACDFRHRLDSRFFQQRRALVQHLLSRRFLFRVDLCARLFQRVLILLELFRCSRLCVSSGLACTHRACVALRHHRQQRLEKQRPQHHVKSQNNQDCRHSLKEQFPKLVNNLLHLSCVA